jgi:hypothetical protein
VKTLTLSPIARASHYVEKIPGAVEGSHGDCQMLAVANVLVWDFALNSFEALDILREYNRRCSPPWTEVELVRKLQSAEKQPHSKPRGHLLDTDVPRFGPSRPMPTPAARVKLDPATAVENFLKGFRCDEQDLWKASPIKPPYDWRLAGAWIMPFLYREDEFINLTCEFELANDGKVNIKGKGEILRRDAWTERLSKSSFENEAGAWIRMNPTLSVGTGKGGAMSDVDVTAFRFALVELDHIPIDLQLPLLAKLGLPIAAILTSGGRSCHAWVRVNAENLQGYKSIVAELLNLLARFGVDDANKNPSRYSRLPGTQRQIGASGDGRQRLIYLNPTPKQEAIL